MATQENKSTKALMDFKSKYPNVTSADLQSFILGYNARSEDIIKLEKENVELRKLLTDIIDNNDPNNYIIPRSNSPREQNRLKRFTDNIKAAEEYLYPDED